MWKLKTTPYLKLCCKVGGTFDFLAEFVQAFIFAGAKGDAERSVLTLFGVSLPPSLAVYAFTYMSAVVSPPPLVLSETPVILIGCLRRVVLTLVRVSMSSLLSSPCCSFWYNLLTDSFTPLWQPFWQISQLCAVVFVLVCNAALRYCY